MLSNLWGSGKRHKIEGMCGKEHRLRGDYASFISSVIDVVVNLDGDGDVGVEVAIFITTKVQSKLEAKKTIYLRIRENLQGVAQKKQGENHFDTITVDMTAKHGIINGPRDSMDANRTQVRNSQ